MKVLAINTPVGADIVDMDMSTFEDAYKFIGTQCIEVVNAPGGCFLVDEEACFKPIYSGFVLPNGAELIGKAIFVSIKSNGDFKSPPKKLMEAVKKCVCENFFD